MLFGLWEKQPKAKKGQARPRTTSLPPRRANPRQDHGCSTSSCTPCRAEYTTAALRKEPACPTDPDSVPPRLSAVISSQPVQGTRPVAIDGPGGPLRNHLASSRFLIGVAGDSAAQAQAPLAEPEQSKFLVRAAPVAARHRGPHRLCAACRAVWAIRSCCVREPPGANGGVAGATLTTARPNCYTFHGDDGSVVAIQDPVIYSQRAL